MSKSMILRYSIAEGYKVTPPKRKTSGSAGLDLHIPAFTDAFIRDFEDLNSKIARIEDREKAVYLSVAPSGTIAIPSHSRCIVPSGLYFDIPEGWMLEGANRGSVSSIQGVIHGAHIIDCDYQGMVFMSIINTSSSMKFFGEGSALLQVLLREAPTATLMEIPLKDLYSRTTQRGKGALGSTDGDEHGGN